MAYDIFLSYRRADQPLARKLVEALEKRGVGVWWDQMIDAGVDWREAIVDGLMDSDMLVILFSDECNSSKQLKKELALADDMDKNVVPVLIEDIKPKGHFLYELSSRNWIQIFPNPHKKIEELADRLTTSAEATPGGLEGRSTARPTPTTATPELSVTDPNLIDDVFSRRDQSTNQTQAGLKEPIFNTRPKSQKKASASNESKTAKDNLRDFLPFKKVDLFFLAPAFAWLLWMASQDMDAGTPLGDILATIILGIGIAAIYGAFVFPFRYYFRRRRLKRAALMYTLSALALYSSIIIIFNVGHGMGSFPYDDPEMIAGIFGVMWLILGVISFAMYGILNFQRAIRGFRRNVQKI